MLKFKYGTFEHKTNGNVLHRFTVTISKINMQTFNTSKEKKYQNDTNKETHKVKIGISSIALGGQHFGFDTEQCPEYPTGKVVILALSVNAEKQQRKRTT